VSTAGGSLPRFVGIRPGPAGSVAGDVHDGRPTAADLLHMPGPDGEVQLGGRRARVSEAPFTATTRGAAAKLDRILNGEGVLVSTGQQPVLFTGPLFTLYKSLTAVAHAQRIEAATGRPALASFWIAGDDHDWDEVGTASLVDRNGAIRRVKIVPEQMEAGRSVGPARLGKRVRPLLEEFLAAAGESEFAAATSGLLRASYTEGACMSDAFRDAFAGLLGNVDLVLFNPAHDEARTAAVPFLTALLEQSEEAGEAFETGTAEVISRGYDPQLRRPEGGAQLFFDDGTARRHLQRVAGGFRAGKEGEAASTSEWRARLEAEPARFSPAAATRPILESWLLPVARTILGPGEMAYWAQLGPLFEQLNVRRPETASRQAWLVVEPRVERWLAAVEADPLELEDGGVAIESRITSEHRPEEIERQLAELRGALEEKTDLLAAATRERLPGLDSAFGKTRKLLGDAIEGLEATIDARVRESRQTSIDRVRRAATLLYPDGRRQERIDSVFSFLVRYGPSFLAALAEEHGVRDGP